MEQRVVIEEDRKDTECATDYNKETDPNEKNDKSDERIRALSCEQIKWLLPLLHATKLKQKSITIIWGSFIIFHNDLLIINPYIN